MIMQSKTDEIIKRRSNLSPAKRAILEKRLRGEHQSDTKQIVIPRRTQQSPVPLSAPQQRLWFLQQLEPQSSVYNEFACIQLKGILNFAALEKSFNEIVKRHESLRTSFETLDEQPVQVIHPTLSIRLPVVNLSDLPQALQDAEIERLTAEIAHKSFDLTSTPLLRVKLLHTGEHKYILLLVLHHIICDGWSIQVLNKELAAIYEAFSAETSSPLAELSIQYADYSIWQRQWLQGEREKTQLSYWKQQLADPPTTLSLPIDHQRPPVQSFKGAAKFFKLSSHLSDQLRTLSNQQGVSLFMTLLTAFKVQLYRYTSQEDICIGSPIANRNHGDIEGLIGFFVNTLALRTDLSGNPSFLELLSRVREVCVEAYAHAELPFERLVAELHPERNLSHTPLFQVTFALQEDTKKDLVLPDLTLKWLENHNGTAKFDLTLNLVDSKPELWGWWEYNTDLFDASTIERMVGHFTNLLEGIVSQPKKRLSELPLLTEAERQTLLVNWNNTTTDCCQDKCIHELFEAQVEKISNAIAVVFEDQQLTYRELNAKANQLAHHLRLLGVKPEVLVGICVERSLDMVIGLLAIPKAGGAYVPLDPNYPQERLAYMLEDSQPSVLLTQQYLLESLPSHQAQVICIDSDWEQIASESTENPVSNTTIDSLAYVIYTSGSTGKPKGAMNSHNGICNRLLWMQDTYQLTSADAVLQKTPFSFDVSVWEFFWTLITGARLVVAQPEGHRDPSYLVNLIRKQRITTLHFVPSMLQVFLEVEGLEKCQSLVRVIASGEALPAQLQERFFNRLNAQLHNLYGPTEAAVDVTYWQCKKDNLSDQNTVPIGQPIANIQIYILDKYLKPVPMGVAGEVYIGGVGVARGYLNRPDLSAEKFIPNPFSTQATRLYKTGDLARYLPSGDIDYIGRIDNQVKIRGFRIELGEIEAVISQYPAVRETVVVVRKDKVDSQQIVAYVVAHLEQTLAITELREFLESKLPNYMVPTAFVTLEELPLTPNGKVDRKALPVPELTQASSSNIVPASTPIENLLVGIWTEVLGIEKVGIDNNFFELGGHSLIATRVISQIRKVFQIEFPLRYLFEKPTIAGLAKEIEKASKLDSPVEATSIERIPRSRQLPLSFAQQRLWFLAQLEPDSPFYNIPGAVRLQGELNVEALQQSFNEIVRRHEALRTNFQTIEGQAVASISEEKPLTLSILDISSLSAWQQEAQVKQQVAQEAQEPFDIKSDNLLRVKLLRLGTQEHIVLLTMHHIVSDGWSVGVLVEELATFYSQLCNREPLTSAELPIQYVDFAAWQRQWLLGVVLKTQVSYWLKQLEGAPKVLELPTDHPRPAIQTYRGATYSFKLSKELSTALNKLSQQQGSTLFMTLLAGFQTLLWRYTAQEDIVVGSPIANRNRAELEGLIGFFVNTLVLRTNLGGNPSFEELLKRVREVALGAYAHQDLPFELLVERLQPQRSLSHAPLFQVMFVLQNAPISALELPGLTLTPLEGDSDTSKFDLTLYMTETLEGLVGNLEYNTDLFEVNTIQRMVSHLQTLLEGIVANPQQRLSELPFLTESEQHKLLREWNDTKVDHPKDKCIHELFEAQVERTPNTVAVVFEDQQLTYCELNKRANQLAHHLRSHGVKPEVLVGICIERSLEMVIGLLAILKASGAYIPLDPSYPKERLQFILEDTQAQVLLTKASLLEGIPQHKAQVVCLDSDWHLIAQQSQENLCALATTDNLAYIIYTSGSTGKPKGVQIPHSALSNFLYSMKQEPGLTSDDILLAVTTYSFDIAALELFLPIIVGARLVVASREIASDGTQLSALLIDSKATVMQATPATWQLLVLAGWDGNPQLKILCGGEALPRHLAFQLLERCNSLWNMYGPTETTIWSAASQIKTDSKIIPISNPIANTQLYILDQYSQLVPVGVAGELCIGGEGLARGYFNRPDLSAEKFIPNPFSNESTARLYKTGDLARYLPSGDIDYIGRIDNQVKIRGFRIELGEIEAIVSQHPAVRETVVVVREDSVDSQQIVAYVVAQQEQTLAIAKLRSFLESKLPNYMVPTAFVTLEALPLTPNGKVDRKALPVPELTQIASSNIVPASTPIENLLAGIWAEILSIEEVGIDNNFFELGGHSLIATRVISQIRQVFQIDLPLRCLFEKPTIAGLAKEIDKVIKLDSPVEATGIERIPRTQQLPLSFAQQRLWFLAQLEPDSAFYNIPAAVRLEGKLNIEALQQSFNEIVRRHEALRTNFLSIEGQAVAVISEEKPLTLLSILDISSLSAFQQQAEVKQQATQEAQQPFDISSDHLLRIKILHLGEQEHIVLLTMHHIVSDGWSISVLIQEFSSLYSNFCNEEPTSKAELPVQYVDFAAWQRQWLQGEVLETQISYWLKQLENAPKVLELPTDHPRSAIQTYRGANYSFELSKELSAALNKLSQQQGTTLFMTLLAGFQTLLWRYTAVEDIVVGSPIANRNRAEIEGLIGFFVNTLVLRTNLGGNPSFEEFLLRVREVTLGAYAHQDLPFELLVERLQPQRDLSHAPLFQVMFVLQNTPISALELPGLTLTPLEDDSDTSKFDLTLYMTETESGLVGSLEYNIDLFEESSIQRMAAHLQTLLKGIVANPKQRLSELPLLVESEQHQLLREWNDTLVDYPQDKCIHELFEVQVEKTPLSVAVVFEDQQLTYCELNAKANQLAHHLRSMGVKPEVLVGICVERSLDMVIGLLAILKAGGAYVPLDPNYPQERISFILEDTQAPVLLTQASFIETIPQHKAQVIYLDDDYEAIAQQSQENLPSELTTDNLAYTIYTSGSTGKPKGVQIPHSALNNFLYSIKQAPGLTSEDTLLAVTTYSFDIAALELFLPIIVGARLVVASQGIVSDGMQLSALLIDSKATVMQATPATWQLLLAASWDGNPQLKILCGGEALPANLASQLLQRCDCLWNMYGPTETTIWSAASEIKTDSKTIPISNPIANTQLYILDQYSQLVPVGVTGELCIGGEGLARDYFKRPDLSAEKFIPNPFSTEATRLYKTGDLARYLPSGDIEYIGRIDNQVKVRGFRIELGEIESVISQYPAVRETVVVVREDEVDSQQIVAYVVSEKEQTLVTHELRSFSESKLPNYMVPTAFITLEALPLTPNGKVDRKALPLLKDANRELESTFVAPRNPVEEVLAGIWTQVLDISQVGIYDNFFELGGHSLLATQVISRIRKTLEVDIPLQHLFKFPKIAELAKEIEQVSTKSISAIMPVPGDGNLPLSFAQARLWLLEQLNPGSYIYNMPAMVRLTGNLNIKVLKESINQIIHRHEALRTTFVLVDGQPVQVIIPNVQLKIPVVNLGNLTEVEREAEINSLSAKEFQRPFDFNQAPLLRCTLLETG